MEIESFRDLVISIAGLAIIGVFILVSILCYLLYRKVNSILKSAKATFKTMQDISAYTKDIITKPLINVTALIQGILQGSDTYTQFTKKKEKEGEKDV